MQRDDGRRATRNAIRAKCREVGDLLVKKNRAYGNSALQPLGIFSRGTAEAQLRARIDDKLSRIKNMEGAFGENDIMDLTGYLVLLMIARDKANEKDKRR